MKEFVKTKPIISCCVLRNALCGKEICENTPVSGFGKQSQICFTAENAESAELNKFILYSQRPLRTLRLIEFAKQSQFVKGQDRHKLNVDTGLVQINSCDKSRKANPIQRQSERFLREAEWKRFAEWVSRRNF